MFILKTLKNTPTCFDHHSDHLQGARMFLVKVTDFKRCKKVNVVMRQHTIWCVYVRSVWRGMLDRGPAYLSTQNARTHTKCYAVASPH